MTVLNKGTKKTQVVEKNKTKTIAAAPTMEKTKYKYTHKSADGRSKKLTIYKTARGKYVVFVNDKKKYLDMKKIMQGGNNKEMMKAYNDNMISEQCKYSNDDFVNFLTNKEVVINNFFYYNDAILEDNLTRDGKEFLNDPTEVFKIINAVNTAANSVNTAANPVNTAANSKIDNINPNKSFTFEQLQFIIMYKMAYAAVNSGVVNGKQIPIRNKSLYLTISSDDNKVILPTIKINPTILPQILGDRKGKGMVETYKFMVKTMNPRFFDTLYVTMMRYTRNIINTNDIKIVKLEVSKEEPLCGIKRKTPNSQQ